MCIQEQEWAREAAEKAHNRVRDDGHSLFGFCVARNSLCQRKSLMLARVALVAQAMALQASSGASRVSAARRKEAAEAVAARDRKLDRRRRQLEEDDSDEGETGEGVDALLCVWLVGFAKCSES